MLDKEKRFGLSQDTKEREGVNHRSVRI